MQCRRSRSTLMGGKTIIRNYNEKNLFSQSSSSEKISLKNMILDNNLESILGGMSENLCQEDLSESSDSTKIESEKNDSIYYRRVIPTHSTK